MLSNLEEGKKRKLFKGQKTTLHTGTATKPTASSDLCKLGKSGQTGKIPAGVMKKHLALADASVPHQLMCVLCDSSTTESPWEFPMCTRLHNTKRRVSKLLTSDLRLDRARMLQRLGKSAPTALGQAGEPWSLRTLNCELGKTLDTHTFPTGCSYVDYPRHHNNFPTVNFHEVISRQEGTKPPPLFSGNNWN